MKQNRKLSPLFALFVITLSLFIHGCASAVQSASGGSHAVTLSSIVISAAQGSTSPTAPSVPKGTTVQLYATGVYSDSTTKDLTAVASWSSTSDATVGNANGDQGLVTGSAVGTSTVTATFGSMSGATKVDVTAAILKSIAVTAPNSSIPKGATGQFTATGTYSDSSTANLTTQVTWASTSPAVVAINTAGLATGAGMGSANITASLSGVTSKAFSLTVTAAALQSINITTADGSVPKGTTDQFAATGTYTDSSTANLTSLVTWTSTSPTVATIAAGGLASAAGIGSSNITASMNGITSNPYPLVVTAAVLRSIAIAAANGSIAKGTTDQFTATGTYSDTSTANLTSQVTWNSSSPAVVAIIAGGLATGASMGSANITASLNGVTSNALSLTVTTATLQSIAITAVNGSIAKGTTDQFTATGTYSDASTANLTSQVTWNSASLTVATIGATGLATGAGIGSSNITASFNGITSNTYSLGVTAATLQSIAITAVNGSIAKGTTDQFAATGTYSDATTGNITSQVTWNSASPTVATIAAGGLATGAGVGSSNITASMNGITNGITSNTYSLAVTAAVLRSISITAVNGSIAKGTTDQFTATGTYSDATTGNITSQVTWNSASPTIATIAAGGLATGAGVGSSNITASMNSTTSNTYSLSVTAAALESIALSETSTSITVALTSQFTATGTYSDGSTADVTSQVSWNSGTSSVATITAAGLVTAVAPGTSNISATLDGIASPSVQINVNAAVLQSVVITATQGSTTPAAPSVANGTSVQLYATGLYNNNSTQDLTTQVSWSSTADATVSNATGSQGLVTGAAVGSATVTATLGTVSGNATVNVTAAILKSISITPNTIASWPQGTTQQFTAIGTFTDSTTQNITSTVTWSASDSSATIIASGTNAGLATGVSQGTVVISASMTGVPTASTQTLTIGPAALVSIAITPADASIALGTNETFTATGTYTDGSTQNLTTAVTWAATPDPSGAATFPANSSIATATAEGVVTITATSTSGPVGTTQLTITAPVLVSIAVTPATAKIYQGGSQQFTATGTFSDNSTQDLTSTVTWATSSGTVATISTSGATSGLASGVGGGGPISISATFGSIVSTTTGGDAALTVVGISSVVLTPANPTVYLGDTNPADPYGASNNSEQFAATVNYADSTNATVTTTATWSSGTTTVATISNTTGTQGLATVLTSGTSTITATYAGASGSTLLTVSPALLESIAITPISATLAPLGTQQFAATGTYSDGSTQDVTSQVAWASSNTADVTVTSPGGLATAVAYAASAVSITASETNAAGTLITSPAATVLVPPPVLLSITVGPPTISLAAGYTQQYTATGNYSDGSTGNLTASVTWASTSPAFASITSAGLASALTVGTTTISATSGTVVGSTTLTVTPPVLLSIAVTPPSVSLGLYATQQYVATGTYSDNSTQVITNTVTWTSGNTSLVSISATGLASVLATSSSAISIIASQTNSAGTLITSPPAWLSALASLPIVCSSPTIDMQLLVVNNSTANYADFPAIQQILNYVGTPYTVVDVTAGTVPTLSDGACHAYYQGVIFANGGDYYTIGSWQSALISYEQTFGIRQVNWYDTGDTNFGLSTYTQIIPASDTENYTANFTSAASSVFFYANTATPLTVNNAAVYLTSADPASTGSLTPLLQDASGNIVSAIYQNNGQEFLTQTFDSNASLMHDLILAYGLVNWVTKGVFLGDYHVYATQSIDDFFIDDSEWIPSTTCLSDPQTFDRTAPDASNLPVTRVNSADMTQLVAWQQSKQADTLLNQFELTIAMNGVGTSGNGDWTGLTAPIISSSATAGVATFTAQDFSGQVGQSVTVTNTTNGSGVLNGTWVITSVTPSAATTPGTTSFTASIAAAGTLALKAENGVVDNTNTATAVIADDLVANLQTYQQYFHWISHTYNHPSTLNGLCKSTPTGSGCGDVNNTPPTDDIDLEVLTNLYTASSAGGVDLDTDTVIGPYDDGSLKPLTFTDFNPANIVTPGVTGLNDPNVPIYLYEDGIRYAVSDTSVATTTDPPNNNGPNPSPNVGIVNSYEPGIYEVPRHPNDVFYNVANWADDQAEFDCVYSYYVAPGAPAGTTPAPDPPFNTYNAAQVLDFTSSAFVSNMLMGDMDPEMFHQPDLHFSDNYANLTNSAPSGTIPASVSSFVGSSGTHVSSLISDTYDLTFIKYEAVYKLPVLTPTMDNLALLMQNRNTFNLSGVSASILNAGTASASISLTMPSTATVPTAVIPVTGLTSTGSESYGGQNISHLTMTPGQAVSYPLN
ncbi:MAG: Ig-like domain-containing protein [Candidatus Acidiferrum sp.]